MVTIIETVSKQNIYDFMDENVFHPLGMTETQVFEGIVDFHCPQRVMGYTEKKDKFRRPSVNHLHHQAKSAIKRKEKHWVMFYLNII